MPISNTTVSARIASAALPPPLRCRTAGSARQRVGGPSSDSKAAASTTRTRKPDAPQPLLSAFFDSKEEAGGASGAAGGGDGGGGERKTSKAEKGVQDGRRKKRGPSVKGEVEPEGTTSSQERIPVRDVARSCFVLVGSTGRKCKDRWSMLISAKRCSRFPSIHSGIFFSLWGLKACLRGEKRRKKKKCRLWHRRLLYAKHPRLLGLGVSPNCNVCCTWCFSVPFFGQTVIGTDRAPQLRTLQYGTPFCWKPAVLIVYLCRPSGCTFFFSSKSVLGEVQSEEPQKAKIGARTCPCRLWHVSIVLMLHTLFLRGLSTLFGCTFVGFFWVDTRP